MANARDLSLEAGQGYDKLPNPHLYSSAVWYAHEIGRHFANTGWAAPQDVRMSRGYHVWASGMLFKFVDEAFGMFSIERVK
jgi:hypothetical protein